MVEVTSDAKEVFNILKEFEYFLYLPDGTEVTDHKIMSGNIFCLNSTESVSKFLQ